MGTLETLRKLRAERKGDGTAIDTRDALIRSRIKRNGGKSYISGFEDWLGAVSKYSTKYVKDSESRADTYQGDFGTYYSDNSAEIERLRKQGKDYKEHFARYGDLYDEIYGGNFAGFWADGYNSSAKWLKDAATGLTRENDFWSQFKDESEYKDWYYYDKYSKQYGEMDDEAYGKAWADVESRYNAANTPYDGVGPSYVPEELEREYNYLKSYGENREIEKQNAEYLAYDAAAGAAEIDRLEQIVSEYEDITVPNTAGMGRDQGKIKAALDNYNNAIAAWKQKYGISYEEAKAQLYEAEKYHKTATNYQYRIPKGKEYDSLRSNADFAQNSGYVSTKEGDREIDWLATIGGAISNAVTDSQNGSQIYYEAGDGYGDIMYDLINGNPEALLYVNENNLRDNGALAVASGIASLDYLTLLEDKEKQIFNYIYHTEGKDAAYEYITFLEPELNARNREATETKWANFAYKHPVLASLSSVALAPAKGVSFLGQTVDYIADGELEDNARYNALLYGGNAVTSTVSEKIEKSGKWGEVGSFGYGVAMSMGEFLLSTAVAGGNPTFAGLIMASGAAADTTLSGVDRGLTGTRAYTSGIIAGLAEFFTEKMGVDNLLDNVLRGKSKFKYFLKNTLSEGIEEGATDLVNWAYDDIYDLISGQSESEWKKMIAKYEEAGYSASVAFGKALGDRALQFGLDIGAGMASGGIMGGGAIALDAVSGARDTAKTGQAFRGKLAENAMEIGDVTTDILGRDNKKTALNENTAAYKQAQKIRERLDKGMSESQTSTAIQTRLSANVGNENDVRKFSDTITDILYGREVSNKDLSSVAANKYALNTLNDVLGAKLKKGATVNDIKAAIESYQASTSKTGADVSSAAKSSSAVKNSGRSSATFAVSKNDGGTFDVVVEGNGERGVISSYKSQKQAQAHAYAMTLDMGANGARGLVMISESLPDGVNLGDAAQAFNAIYSQGKGGKAFSAVKFGELLSSEQRQYAYQTGVVDGLLERGRNKNSPEVLQNDGGSGTIKENTQEDTEYERGEETGGVRLRDGSKRDGGQDPGGQISSVEGSTGQAEGGRKDRNTNRPRDREAASLAYEKEVSAKSLGIEGGLDSGKVHLIAEGSETASMKKARARAEKRGKKVTFFAGENLRIEQDDVVISARGYIEGDNVYVRVDHPYYTADQLMRHELGHDMIARGEVNVDEVRERIKDRYEDVDFIVERYVEAYEGSGLDADEIWEEIICDSLGDMNIFASVEVLGEMNDEFLEALKEETRKSAKDARGPPRSAEGKASRGYWYPKLTNQEWSLLNRTMNRELSGSKNYINEATKWLYAEEKGVRVFAIYGIGDGTEATVLYAVGGRSADSMIVWRKKYESGLDQTKRNPYRKHLDSIRVEPNKHGFGIDGNGQNDIRGNGGTTKKTTSRAGQIPNGTQRGNNRGAVPSNSGQQVKGKASQDLDFVDFLNENIEERERSNREILANLLETEDMSPSEKGFLTKYKNKIAKIEVSEAEIASIESELKELRKAGKKDSSRAITLEGKIEARRKEIARDENMILNLESTNSIKRLLKSEKDAAYAEGMLAGQMAQGRQDAAKLRKTEEKLAEQKRKDGETLTEYKKRVAEREAEIKQKNREKLAEQREKARENLDAQAKKYREAKQRESDRRHSSEIRGKIKEFKDKLQKMLDHPTDRKYIPGALAKAIIDVCELIDTDTELYKADGSLNKAQQRRNETRERLAKLREEYKKISVGADDLVRQEFDGEISGYLEKLESDFKGKSLNDMSRAELEEMYEILSSIDGTLKNARKLLGEKDATDVYEAGDAVISEQRDIANKRKNGKRNAAQKLNDGVGNSSLSPMRRVLEICGYNKDSALYKLFKQLEVGVRKAEFFKMGAKKSFEALTTGKYADVYEKAIYQADGGEKYTDVDGHRFGISKMGKMQAILSFEREAANKKTHHIEKGGLVFADLRELGKGKLKTAVDAEHSHKVVGAEAVKLIEQFKTELEGDRWAQKYMAAARFFFNNTAKNAINDTYMQLKHRILATDDAYIPFEVDQNSIVKEITGENDIQQTISSYGMLKDMQKGASNPLIITGLNNVLERHIEQVATIQGLAIPIRDFNKVWSVKSADGTITVKEQIQKVAGDGAVKVITQTVRDLQGDRPKSDKLDRVSRVYRKVKSNYISATFFANVSVMLKQIGSMFSAVAVIGYRDPVRMMGNLIYTFANSKKIAAEVDKYTATAWMRRQGLSDAELKTLATERRKTKVGKFFDRFGSGGMIMMDYNVALSLWKYAKQDVAKKTGLRGEELLKATAEFYDEVIETTQSMTDVLHRPEIQRSGGVGTELLGTFKTDLYQNAGNLRVAIGEFAHNRTQENAKKLAKTVSGILTSAMWGSIITSLVALARYKVDRYRDEEDDELTAESWLKVQGMDLLQELAGYVVPSGGSEVVEGIRNRKSGSSWGNVFASAIPFDAVNDLYSDICTISQKIETGKDLTMSDYFKIIKDCGNVLGIPTSNFLRTLEAGYLHIKDAINGEPLSFESGLEDSNAYRLYKAMLEGDTNRIDKASRNFKNQDAITKAIRGQLRERDPRVKEAAAALDGGDVRKWRELYNEILDEGHFDAEDIKAAIESEQNSYSSKIESAAQAKLDGNEDEYESILDEIFENFETVFDEEKILDDIDAKQVEIAEEEDRPKEGYSEYKPSYVNDAFNSGDTELALEILEELISNKTDYYLEKARYEAEKNGDKFNERKARKEAEEKAESSLRSSITSYWKPKYIAAHDEGDQEEMERIREILDETGFYDSVRKTVNGWVK